MHLPGAPGPRGHKFAAVSNAVLQRCRATRAHRGDTRRCLAYRASVAQRKAERSATRPGPAKLAAHARRRPSVQARLAGKIHDADGHAFARPSQAPFRGEINPIAVTGKREAMAGLNPLPNDCQQFSGTPRLSASPMKRFVRRSIFRGAVRSSASGQVPVHRPSVARSPGAGACPAGAHVSEEVMLSSRPPEAQDRAVPGHWEGVLLIGLKPSAISPLLERPSRFAMLVHLPRQNGDGLNPPTKNGPPLDGDGAVTTAAALKKTRSTGQIKSHLILSTIATASIRRLNTARAPVMTRCDKRRELLHVRGTLSSTALPPPARVRFVQSPPPSVARSSVVKAGLPCPRSPSHSTRACRAQRSSASR